MLVSDMQLPPPPGEPPSGQPPSSGEPAKGPGPVAIRPLTLGEVLDGAFKILVANWRTLFVVVGVFLVPLQMLSAYLQRDLLGGGMLEMLTDPTAAEMWESGGAGQDLAMLLSLVQVVLITPLMTGAVAAVAGASYQGASVAPGEALATGLRRWWALVSSWLLLILASMLPVLLAVGGIALAVAGGLPVAVATVLGIVLVLGGVTASAVVSSLLAAAPAAIVIERLGALRGLRRSARLLRPRLLPVIGTLTVAILLVALLSLALGGIPQFFGMVAGEQWGWVLVAVGGILAGLVTTPLLAIVLTLLYFDGRVRNEAFDLRLTADSLSGAPTDGEAPGGFPAR